MVGPISPSDPNQIPMSNPPTGKPNDPNASFNAMMAPGPTYKTVLGMPMTKLQYAKFVANLCNSITFQINNQTQRMKAASDKLKRAELGEDDDS